MLQDSTRTNFSSRFNEFESGAKVYLEQMGKQEKFVQDFKLEPINVKKALDTLDLDPKVESKLAKALVGTRSAMEKIWTRPPEN